MEIYDMSVKAFISCRFPVVDTVKNICDMLKPEIEPYISKDVKHGSLPLKIKEKISFADCLIAIITEDGNSAFIQNELGIAFALHKPIFAIYEQSIDVAGIQPFLSTFIKYSKENISSIASDIISLKSAIATEIASREVVGSEDELLESLHENGIQGIYHDRSTAFIAFSTIWERETNINIIGSSIEGFKRGIGIEARELLLTKLKSNDNTNIKILLTHSSFAKYRETQEKEKNGYIVDQIKATTLMLEEIKSLTNSADRFLWKYFKGAPTCFMIMAGSFMLLNPYLYMQPAYFNFSMIVKDTNSPFDIFNHYKQYHFQRAWDHTTLSVQDSGVKTKKHQK